MCVFQRRRSVMGVWQNHWRLALQLLAVSTGLGSLQSVRGQCFGGVETYEKTSGTTVACDVPGTSCTSKGLLTQPDTSVTRDCIAICKQSAKCNSFTFGKNYAHCRVENPILRIYYVPSDERDPLTAPFSFSAEWTSTAGWQPLIQES